MTPDDFSTFFRELHGKTPFPWQADLSKYVIGQGEWPGLLDLPTGAGKTAVIDVAVFALALEADRPEGRPRRAPLRTFFVVDRRIVVDEAARRARRIAVRLKVALRDLKPRPVVSEVARRLARLAGWDPDDLPPEEVAPLSVAVLRGGMYRDDSWAQSPAQPLICASTVDQVGSRLLFRGYGLGRSGRVVHAGLVGNDSLILLDEAHLSDPFRTTAKAIERFRQPEGPARGTHAPDLPFRIVSMSATPGEEVRAFRLSAADREDETLRRRLIASKLALLDEEVSTVKGNDEANQEKLARRLADHALDLSARTVHAEAKEYTPHVIGVVVNRVDTARRVYRLLDEAREEASEVILLTGRIRPIDRDRLLARYLKRMKAGRDRGEDSGKLFVCATQTIECGADLDLDALVTEIAPLDALRQRFGRLDRLGELVETNAVIVARKDGVAAGSSDPIYGESLARTWKWLTEQAGSTKKKERSLDFGIDAMDRRVPKAPDDLDPLRSPRPSAPVLLPAHLDTWVQTEPVPEPDPDVSLFLHGPRRSADVQIVWRADLTEDIEEWVSIVSLAAPSALEALPVPVHAARAWLTQVGEGPLSDIEGQAEADEKPEPRIMRKALRWRGSEGSKPILPEEIRPGDTLIVPSEYGGSDRFGWNPVEKSPVEDVGDLAALLARGKPVLRIHPSVVAAWQPPPDGDQPPLADRIRVLLNPSENEEDEGDPPDVEKILETISSHPNLPPWASLACEKLLGDTRRVLLDYSMGVAERYDLVLRGRQRLRLNELRRLIGEQEPEEEDGDLLSETDPDAPAGDDPNSFCSPLRPVTLGDHCNAVGELAKRSATAIGLPESIVDSLEFSGKLHDLGKLDPRFQAWLCGGDEFEAMKQTAPLAKSIGVRQDRASIERARQRAGYPKGARHEALSVTLTRDNPGLWARSKGARMDLVRHLIGTHHGRGRPFWPVVRDTESESVRYTLSPGTLWPSSSAPRDGSTTTEPGGVLVSAHANPGLHRLDSGWTDAFWLMVRDYGPWGLALLEAILILADHQRSRTEQEDPS
jgi:CRISPR-associated endonuclease/helicase Cas3